MSITVKGRMKGMSRSVTIKADNTNDGKTARVCLEFTMTEKQARARFGQDWADAAFAAYVGEGDAAVTFLKQVKFDSALQVKTDHLIEFTNGGDISYPLVAKPKLGDAHINQGRRVTVPIEIPIPATAQKLINLVASTVGDPLSVHFKGEAQTEMFEA